MPLFTQILTVLVAAAYVVCVKATNALAGALLTLRSFLPENPRGFILSGEALDRLPELPAPLLVRTAFVVEQAGLLWLVLILLLMLCVPPIAANLTGGQSAPQARTSNALDSPDEGPDVEGDAADGVMEAGPADGSDPDASLDDSPNMQAS